MTEAIVCAIIAAVTAIVVGVIDFLSQRSTKNEMYRNKEERQQREQDKEKSRKEFELHMIRGIMASNTLGEATARAVQRIPDAHCNGDMDAALEEEGKVKKDIQDFLARQGVDNIVD